MTLKIGIDKRNKNVIQLYYKQGGDVMAKEATLQVRMDADLKEEVEALYRDMGTSFAEAVRIFAKQSVQENGMPFVVTANRKNTYARLSKYVDKSLMAEEKNAYERVMVEKH
jgi:DNA-damage-inducible protein J